MFIYKYRNYSEYVLSSYFRIKECMRKLFMRLFLVSILLISLCGCADEADVYLASAEEASEMSREEDPKQNSGAGRTDLQTEDAETGPELIFVYVCGCVKNEGVYRLPRGARVFEAIEAAGGFLPEADTSSLNQAEILGDAQKIQVISLEESERMRENSNAVVSDRNAGNNTGGSSGVNINTADRTELMTLPGIGESKAQKIIDFREQNGAFGSIEEIMNVPGIKEGSFSQIKDLITID